MLSLGNNLASLSASLLDIIRSGLKLSLPFISNVLNANGQFSLDETTNNNDAKLLTGNCLNFDGVNDYVQVPNSNSINLGTSDFTFAFWINKVASGSGTQRVIDKRSVKGYTVYLDTNNVLILELNDGSGNVGFTLGTITDDVYQRIIVSADRSGNATCYIDNVAQTPVDISSKQSSLDDSTDLFIGADAPSSGGLYFMGKLSDIQIWNSAWSATDVANDYANPNQLVSSVSVSNLKAWYAFTEGSGSVAVDNATLALGSELITDGDFPSGTSAWLPSSTGITFGDGFVDIAKTPPSTGIYVYQSILGANKLYKVTFSAEITSGTLFFGVNGDTAAQKKFTAGTYSNESFGFTTSGGAALFQIRNPNTGSEIDARITNVSVKEISSGTINGATYVDSQSSILQLGMINWSNGSGVFLPPSPTNSAQDILGNAVRDRLNSLNLTGTGYGEVADDDSINPTDAITIQCWIKSNTEGNKGLVAKFNNSVKDYLLLKQADFFKFQIGTGSTDFLESGTIAQTGWINVAGTYDKSNIKTFINGVESTTASLTVAIPDNTMVLEIGRYNNNNFHAYSERIDDVKIYDRALSADEILQNYKAGTSAHTN